MHVKLKGQEFLIQTLNDWYISIRSRDVSSAKKLKQQSDEYVDYYKQEQNLYFYYSLLNFRHNYLISNLAIRNDSFENIDNLEATSSKEDYFSYYYHFFKAIHAQTIGHFNEAENHYKQAEQLLLSIHDDLEVAEFYYHLSIYYCYRDRMNLANQHISKAKSIFQKNIESTLSLAFCENLLGLINIHEKKYDLAEEYLKNAQSMFSELKNNKGIIITTHNLGFLYSEIGNSILAIEQASKVLTKQHDHYKALFILAKENYKLQKYEKALEVIDVGLNFCLELKNIEYIHHFQILKSLNNKDSINQLETIISDGILYFEKEGLFSYVKEYSETLANILYQLEDFKNSSKYFRSAYIAAEKLKQKELLK
ncbi:response regulator aspartate phosphatase [Bacillus thuringiensis]|uniref:Uncharacterized protein n=1 Tax=Bacillus thuringiensis DB27 TaxID=1431339 RepID=W8ZBA1_BACTU|nr:tetratricopeptide repeat protein [Bacillus thuringiensis]MBG9503840.1 hypothetical protein [Bacillus thuringiensis]MBG9630306.1 hypothetical protein [Bacillus thuringiensis]MBG9669264.1 hypothetical protein [Bacillus thuringiensis]MBH0355908.1 hypothetical protein [Bacillus thuringiensis]CDN39740.1 unnamed protein product [Bacillus thuringiensis DB27]